MSFIYRDFLTPSRFRWNMSSRMYHRFNRVWDKQTINGVQVYSPVLYYWAGALRSDKPFKMFLNALGVEYATLAAAQYEGVENVYFKLTPSKYTYSAPEKTAIVTDLNSIFNINDEFELYVHYTGESKRVLQNQYSLRPSRPLNSTNLQDYTIDKNAIRASLEANPMKYFANAALEAAGELNTTVLNNIRGASTIASIASRITPAMTPLTVIEYEQDTTHLYATLALLDNGSMFQKLGISSEMVTIKKSDDTMVWYDYSYKVRYKVIAEAVSTLYIITQIDLLTNAIQDSLTIVNGNVFAKTNHVADTKLKEAAIAMNNTEAVGLTYNGQLRVDAVANMKRKDFADMLGKIFGTGYTKKKVKWYEKALGFLILIIAVVVGVLLAPETGGTSLGLIYSASAALTIMAAVATVGMMLYAQVFPYATDQMRMIGKFAQIAGLAAMVTGIYAAVQNAWQTYSRQMLAQQAMTMSSKVIQPSIGGFIKYTITNAISTSMTSMQSMFESFFTKLTEPSQWMSGLGQFTMNDVGGWLKNLNTGLDMYMKFFGDKPQDLTAATDEQAEKEDGVESLMTTLGMLDEVDALVRLDYMVKGNNGGEVTERYLSKI